MIGNTADRLGLRVAMGIPLAAALVIIALARSLNTEPAREAGPAAVAGPRRRKG